MIKKAILFVLISVFAAQAQQQNDWPTATPKSVGLDEKALAAFDAEIASGKFGNMDGLTIIRHGKLVFDKRYPHDYEKIYGADAKKETPLNAGDLSGPYNYYASWWHPWYQRGELHTLQSVSKTITSIIFGVARARGDFPDIDTPVLKYFDESKIANVDDRKRRMTIRHLLTMSAGLDWNEELPYSDPKNTGSQMEASHDWVEYTINRPMAFEPGQKFAYNSGATQILAHVFRVATGMDIEEYAVRHLFTPLGIRQFFWKRSPSGLVDAEGGIYLRPRDLAKLWYVFLRNGKWEGKQIITPEWIKDSLTPHMDLGPNVKYGLKWWLYPYGKDNSMLAWSGNGFGGQRPLVLPEYDMVVVYTAWNVNPGPAMGTKEAIDRSVGLVTDGKK
ncbi:MAG: serine hydrolase [Acidobacteria bacterium]|nr:serine hydrolase [Acidobacteriota bacterium]